MNFKIIFHVPQPAFNVISAMIKASILLSLDNIFELLVSTIAISVTLLVLIIGSKWVELGMNLSFIVTSALSTLATMLSLSRQTFIAYNNFAKLLYYSTQRFYILASIWACCWMISWIVTFISSSCVTSSLAVIVRQRFCWYQCSDTNDKTQKYQE